MSSLASPLREPLQVDLVELDGERAVEHLRTEHVGRFVDVHGAGEEDVARHLQLLRHRPGRFGLAALDCFVLVKRNVLARFQRRQEVREVVFDAGQVHLVENDEEGVGLLAGGLAALSSSARARRRRFRNGVVEYSLVMGLR